MLKSRQNDTLSVRSALSRLKTLTYINVCIDAIAHGNMQSCGIIVVDSDLRKR